MSTDVLVSTQDFLTAGLNPEGVYRMRVKSLGIVERIAQGGRTPGESYKKIEGQVDLVEKLGDGVLEYPINAYFSAYTSGRQLAKFRNLYNAKFGSAPQSQPGTVSLNDLASALIGTDDVWCVLYWKRNKNDHDDIREEMGYSFSTDASAIKAPKPFVQRDVEFKAQTEQFEDEVPY